MKKILTVLLIALMVMGSVFATAQDGASELSTDTANLTMNVTINKSDITGVRFGFTKATAGTDGFANNKIDLDKGLPTKADTVTLSTTTADKNTFDPATGLITNTEISVYYKVKGTTTHTLKLTGSDLASTGHKDDKIGYTLSWGDDTEVDPKTGIEHELSLSENFAAAVELITIKTKTAIPLDKMWEDYTAKLTLAITVA